MNWYVVVTKVGSEARIKPEMIRAGIEFFIPTMRFVTYDRRKNVKITVTKPLFNRYIFIQSTDLYKIHSCDSIMSVLGVRGEPTPVRDADVVQWREAVAAGIFDKLPIDKGQIRRGMQVKIGSGPLTGYYGHVQSATGKGMVKVMVDFLGRQTPVSLGLDDLEKVA